MMTDLWPSSFSNIWDVSMFVMFNTKMVAFPIKKTIRAAKLWYGFLSYALPLSLYSDHTVNGGV